MTPRND